MIRITDNTIHSVKGLLWKNTGNDIEFLVIEESDTGLSGFAGGAQEEEDPDITSTLEREVTEELGISNKSYSLIDPKINHEFVHEDIKSSRYGKKGIVHIFLLLYNNKEAISPSTEIKEVYWLKEEEVISKLSHSYGYWIPLFKQAVEYLRQLNN